MAITNSCVSSAWVRRRCASASVTPALAIANSGQSVSSRPRETLSCLCFKNSSRVRRRLVGHLAQYSSDRPTSTLGLLRFFRRGRYFSVARYSAIVPRVRLHSPVLERTCGNENSSCPLLAWANLAAPDQSFGGNTARRPNEGAQVDHTPKSGRFWRDLPVSEVEA